MHSDLLLQMFFNISGGLGLFLLGMKNMSDGLQSIAGERLKKIISLLTTNRFLSVFVGFLITAFIQSSSVTTVMTVGLVNSGLMSLAQSIGVIMGANIGTTVTGWILVLKIGKYGLPLLGIAAMFFLFGKEDKKRFYGMTFMGLGMVFFGLELMTAGFKPFKTVPEFEKMFLYFTADTYFGMWKCVIVGCILTMIVQSSSATLGITMGLASTGAISFSTAAALVLGENIGTTITANIASIGANSAARRTARAHMIFNVLGVLWITSIFPLYLKGVSLFLNVDPHMMVKSGEDITYPYILKGIATVHTGFNILNVLVFLPFIFLIEKVVTYMVPEEKEGTTMHLQYINSPLLQVPSIALEQSANELKRVSDIVKKMQEDLKIVILSKEEKEVEMDDIFKKEELLDLIQTGVVSFLSELLTGRLPASLVEKARRQIRLIDEFESISDYIVRIVKLHLRLKKNNQIWSSEKQAEISKLHEQLMEYIEIIHQSMEHLDLDLISKMETETPQLVRMIKEFRHRHLVRLSKGGISPLESTSYTDLLNSYRRINDHFYNIKEILTLAK